ncbi:putative fructosyl amino acid protein [Naviculisporaceae sp. PSN 640]
MDSSSASNQDTFSSSSTSFNSSPTTNTSSQTAPFSPPSSLLIIGSGVFGLSTALALTRRPQFSSCSITVVDRSDAASGVFPAADAASVDTSRIIRADYADSAYAALGAQAQLQWRKQTHPADLGAQGRYTESGLLLVADGPAPPPNTPPTPPADLDKTKLTGMDYARLSWTNVLSLASQDPALARQIRELPDAASISLASRTGGRGSTSGTWGYINEGSGWADAGASMAWLYEQVKQTGGVTFVAGTVTRLERAATKVTGATLSDGRVLTADLVVLAAGAWTASLLDISTQAVATGQNLGYIDITQEEQDQLSNMPVILNLTSGLFVIPPRDRVLKVARHAYGYLNPTPLPTAPLPLSPSTVTSNQSPSLPRTTVSDPTLAIPAEGQAALRACLREMIPIPAIWDRPFSKTRLCWYSDTPTGDFVVDYHPEWQGLFVAFGDSGHAFKFLPVLGEKVVDCITRQRPTEFEGKWKWKAGNPTSPSLVTEDGSRGGQAGLILDEELAKEL